VASRAAKYKAPGGLARTQRPHVRRVRSSARRGDLPAQGELDPLFCLQQGLSRWTPNRAIL